MGLNFSSLTDYISDYSNRLISKRRIVKESKQKKDYVLFPVPTKYLSFWNFYQKQIELHWTASEINFPEDLPQWRIIKENHPKTTNIVKKILVFFSQLDGMIADNITTNFSDNTICIQEDAALAQQTAVEYMHAHTYGLALEIYSSSEKEREDMEKEFNESPSISAKAKWTTSLMNDATEENELERIVAFALIEGIHFISAFSFVYWLRHKSFLHKFVEANELIQRDEMLHMHFGCYRYTYRVENGIKERLSDKVVYKICSEVVELELDFLDEIIPEDFDDLRKEELACNIHNLANDVLTKLGYAPLYDVDTNKLPPWLLAMSMTQKNDFYSGLITAYRTPTDCNDKNKEKVDLKSMISTEDF